MIESGTSFKGNPIAGVVKEPIGGVESDKPAGDQLLKGLEKLDARMQYALMLQSFLAARRRCGSRLPHLPFSEQIEQGMKELEAKQDKVDAVTRYLG